MAAVFTSNTTAADRNVLLQDFRSHRSELRVLISVEALAKGFDVPDVSCIVDCRPPRKSLSSAIQMWGRGLRSSPETGKTNCLLLDRSGNIHRFADDFTTIFFDGLAELDAGEKLDNAIRKDVEETVRTGCPICGAQPSRKRCIACGFAILSRSGIEYLPGEMREVVLTKTRVDINLQHLWAQLSSYVKVHNDPDKQHGRVASLFKDITGKWPPSHWSVHSAPAAEVTTILPNKIKSIDIAASKRRQRQYA